MGNSFNKSAWKLENKVKKNAPFKVFSTGIMPERLSKKTMQI